MPLTVLLPAIPPKWQLQNTAQVADLTPANHQTLSEARLAQGNVLFNREGKVRVGTSADDAGTITLINIYGEVLDPIPAVKSGEYIPGVYRGISSGSNISNVTIHYSGPNKIIVGTETPEE